MSDEHASVHPFIISLSSEGLCCQLDSSRLCWEVGGVGRGICGLVQSFMQQDEELRVWDRRLQSLWGEGSQQTPSRMLLLSCSIQQRVRDGSLAWKTIIATGWQRGSGLHLVQRFRSPSGWLVRDLVSPQVKMFIWSILIVTVNSPSAAASLGLTAN